LFLLWNLSLGSFRFGFHSVPSFLVAVGLRSGACRWCRGPWWGFVFFPCATLQEFPVVFSRVRASGLFLTFCNISLFSALAFTWCAPSRCLRWRVLFLILCSPSRISIVFSFGVEPNASPQRQGPNRYHSASAATATGPRPLQARVRPMAYGTPRTNCARRPSGSAWLLAVRTPVRYCPFASSMRILRQGRCSVDERPPAALPGQD
jgi:hypothetical protein